MNDGFVYSKRDQARVDRLNERIHELEVRQQKLRREIEEIEAGQSPIKVGDLIQWESGNRLRRGRVKSVRASWKGFQYRCHILTAAGKEIGYAEVGSDRCPVLAEDGK